MASPLQWKVYIPRDGKHRMLAALRYRQHAGDFCGAIAPQTGIIKFTDLVVWNSKHDGPCSAAQADELWARFLEKNRGRHERSCPNCRAGQDCWIKGEAS